MCIVNPIFDLLLLNPCLTDTQFLQIISSQYSKYQDVLLIVSKTDLTNGTCLANSSTTNLLAVRVVNGKPNWERNVTSMHYLNCSLIDANRDGVDDCLIFSTGRGLSALDAQSGTFLICYILNALHNFLILFPCFFILRSFDMGVAQS